ncbi:GIVxVP protein [Synechococcus sp. CCAP 1479/9]|uniref:GIVxVP protein n=1 Tax=Synechococcus sp. CCAP 1479/9 TaxID=1221593 RepID=UPI001C230529|nr:GIVxVP protein [Synechococcus sp. CCAP 1479/9]
MSLNRTAKGIVLVPTLLLGGAFLAAGTWVDGPAAANRGLALTLGAVLMAAGLLAQLLPESGPPATDSNADSNPDANPEP